MILLSHIIEPETPTYGNRDSFIIEGSSQIADGSSANSSKWTFTTNHLGTHIDMPKHFFEEGYTITDVPLNFWISDKVQVIEVPCTEAKLIEIKQLSKEINNETEILLIKTGYEKFRNTDKYWNDNPGLLANMGTWLRKNRPNIKIIGFDFISLSSWKFKEEGKEAHRVFLNPKGTGDPICIIEDMSLCNISDLIKKIIISPVFVKCTNGSPVTIFAII